MVGSFGDFEGENDSYTTVVLASYQVVYLYISDFNRVYVISYQVSVVLKFYHFGKKKKYYHQENNHSFNDALFFRKITTWLFC